MVTVRLAVCIAFSIVLSTRGVSAAEDVSANTVVCKLQVSIPGWLDIADQSCAIAEQATGVPKIIFSALHDSMKGSADIVNAIANVTALSREGLYQLNQNCVVAPPQIENVVASVSVQYPDFGTKFKTQLDALKNTAERLSSAIAKC